MNEDVFPIEHGDVPASHLSFQGCKSHQLLTTYPDHLTHTCHMPRDFLQVLSAAAKCTGANGDGKVGCVLDFLVKPFAPQNHWIQIGSYDSLRVFYDFYVFFQNLP